MEIYGCDSVRLTDIYSHHYTGIPYAATPAANASAMILNIEIDRIEGGAYLASMILDAR